MGKVCMFWGAGEWGFWEALGAGEICVCWGLCSGADLCVEALGHVGGVSVGHCAVVVGTGQ